MRREWGYRDRAARKFKGLRLWIFVVEYSFICGISALFLREIVTVQRTTSTSEYESLASVSFQNISKFNIDNDHDSEFGSDVPSKEITLQLNLDTDRESAVWGKQIFHRLRAHTMTWFPYWSSRCEDILERQSHFSWVEYGKIDRQNRLFGVSLDMRGYRFPSGNLYPLFELGFLQFYRSEGRFGALLGRESSIFRSLGLLFNLSQSTESYPSSPDSGNDQGPVTPDGRPEPNYPPVPIFIPVVRLLWGRLFLWRARWLSNRRTRTRGRDVCLALGILCLCPMGPW
jgi:hypothetical protein